MVMRQTSKGHLTDLRPRHAKPRLWNSSPCPAPPGTTRPGLEKKHFDGPSLKLQWVAACALQPAIATVVDAKGRTNGHFSWLWRQQCKTRRSILLLGTLVTGCDRARAGAVRAPWLWSRAPAPHSSQLGLTLSSLLQATSETNSTLNPSTAQPSYPGPLQMVQNFFRSRSIVHLPPRNAAC